MSKNRDLLSKIGSFWSLARDFGAIPLIGGALSGAIAYFTEFMDSWAPLSWFAAVVTGAIIFQVISLLFSMKNEWDAKRHRIELLQEPKGQINPLDTNFEGKRIYISDLIPIVGSKIKDKNFKNCEIIGSANILFANCRVNRVAFVDSDGVITDNNTPIYNTITFEGCTISDCKLYHVTVIMPVGAFLHHRKVFSVLHWLNEGMVDSQV